MTPNFHNTKPAGFIKGFFVILVAVVLLAVSGISVRKYLNPEKMASTTEQVTQKGESFYTQRLEKPLNTIIITPASIAWEYIEEYGVGSITDWFHEILNE
jgi:hypothetical protein